MDILLDSHLFTWFVTFYSHNISAPIEFGAFSLFNFRFIFAIFTLNAHLWKSLFYLITYMRV